MVGNYCCLLLVGWFGGPVIDQHQHEGDPCAPGRRRVIAGVRVPAPRNAVAAAFLTEPCAKLPADGTDEQAAAEAAEGEPDLIHGLASIDGTLMGSFR